MASKLDANQCIKTAFDDSTETLKVSIPAVTTEIELDASDGDSVLSHTYNVSNTASLDNSSTGVVISEFDISGLKNFNLYTKTLTAITGAQVLTFQISPADSGDVWIDTSLTITPSTTANVVVSGTVATNIVARRGRVSIAAAITTGTFDVYAVGQS